jgi:hypothetical protein
LRIEWRTVEENDLAAFEIYCKEEDEPLSAYHLVDTRLAQGSKAEGAHYQFDITQGIKPDTTYCFRLKEITIDDRRGDILDFCGYGLNISPIEVTPQSVTETITMSPTLSMTATITTTVTITDTQGITIIDSLTITPTSLTTESTPTPFGDSNANDILVLPTETPTSESAITATPIDEPIVNTPTLVQTPIITATMIEQSAPELDSPLPTPTASPVFTPAQSSAISTTGSLVAGSLPNSQSGNGAVGTTNTTTKPFEPNPAYIVLTVTPTDASVALAPTFTPFPTAVTVVDENLIATTLPNSQNLMILLLCGVFSGASGLGVLGVVTTLLYMRSRNTDTEK